MPSHDLAPADYVASATRLPRSGTAAGLLRQRGHAGALNVGGFEALAAAGAGTA